MSAPPLPLDEWVAYLDAFEASLDSIRAVAGPAGDGPAVNGAPIFSTPPGPDGAVPLVLAPRAEALLAESQRLVELAGAWIEARQREFDDVGDQRRAVHAYRGSTSTAAFFDDRA